MSLNLKVSISANSGQPAPRVVPVLNQNRHGASPQGSEVGRPTGLGRQQRRRGKAEGKCGVVSVGCSSTESRTGFSGRPGLGVWAESPRPQPPLPREVCGGALSRVGELRQCSRTAPRRTPPSGSTREPGEGHRRGGRGGKGPAPRPCMRSCLRRGVPWRCAAPHIPFQEGVSAASERQRLATASRMPSRRGSGRIPSRCLGGGTARSRRGGNRASLLLAVMPRCATAERGGCTSPAPAGCALPRKPRAELAQERRHANGKKG